MTTEKIMMKDLVSDKAFSIFSFLEFHGGWHRAEDLSSIFVLGDTHATCPKARALVRELVMAGAPIVSGPKGYRFERNPREVAKRAASLHRRALWLLVRANRLEQTAVELHREAVAV